jgi:drug/metabolite transporter (DMT)-like permease
MNTIIASIVNAFIYGIYPFIIGDMSRKLGSDTILFFTSMLFFAMSTLYIIFGKRKDIREIINIDYKSFLLLLTATFLGFFLFSILYIYIVEKSTYLNICIAIISLNVLITLLLSIALKTEKVNKYTIIGILLTTSGVFSLAISRRGDNK